MPTKTNRRAALPKPIKSRDPVVILRHVIKLIREEPKRYDQAIVMDTNTYDDGRYFPACGTVACVAGWTNILTNARDKFDLARAGRILRLDSGEQNELFGSNAVRWRGVLGSRRHASAGIKHIQRFVLKKWGKKI